MIEPNVPNDLTWNNLFHIILLLENKEKIMKKALNVVLIICLLASVVSAFAGCNTEINTDAPNNNDPRELHVIELSNENYQKYLDWSFDYSTNTGIFEGVLNYALYDISVVVKRTFSSDESESTYEETFTFSLNAAGCTKFILPTYTSSEINKILPNDSFYAIKYSTYVEIVMFTGTVRFYI